MAEESWAVRVQRQRIAFGLIPDPSIPTTPSPTLEEIAAQVEEHDLLLNDLLGVPE